MADISQELQAIMQAVYGEDVRGSIHNAIKKINDVSEVVLSVGTAVTSASSPVTGFFEDSLYINSDTYDLWQCTGTAWALKGNLEGATIASVTKIDTQGLVDTYQINLTNGQTGGTFTVTNGRDATGSTFATLDDVTFTSLADKQIAQYDSTTQKWKNSSALVKTEEMIAPVEKSPATNSHAIGDQIIYNDVLYDVILAISPTDSLVVGTNIAVADSVSEQIADNESAIQALEIQERCIGEIKAFMRKTAPTGYLACDGTVYNIADYPLLAAMFAEQFTGTGEHGAAQFGGDGTTTFAVPDLRGEFLRGTGTATRNTGTGLSVGGHQDGTNHVFIGWGGNTSSINRPYVGSASGGEEIYPTQIDISVTSAGFQQIKPEYSEFVSLSGTQIAKKYTSRPTNTSVLYCIRAY